MKFRWFILLCVLLTSVSMSAALRTPEEASVLAARVLCPATAAAAPGRAGAAQMRLVQTTKKVSSDEPAFYVFNASTAGWVVVSADDRTLDVLCYSERGEWSEAVMNPGLRWWLGRLCREVSSVTDAAAFSSEEREARYATTMTAISPMLKNTQWGQSAPYFYQCPLLNGKRCLTGCVATAAAQVLHYWRYPSMGKGNFAYVWHNQTLSVDYGSTTYDWDNMLDKYSGSASDVQNQAVATLMYHCGVACKMDYSPDASGAYLSELAKGLVRNFGYRYTRYMDMYSNPNLKVSDFETAFHAELEAGRPIIMGGVDKGDGGGHCFVCDGRGSDGRFHINWGWDGSGDCYTELSVLKPTGYNYQFTDYLDAILGLEPNKAAPVRVTGVKVSPAALTLDINAYLTISAVVQPSNADNTSYTWTSEDPKVASVDELGRVTGVAAGTTRVYAKTSDGGFRGYCDVTVTNKVATYVLVTDTILASDLAATTQTYSAFSGVQKSSGAVYSGMTATYDHTIILRTKNANSGIIATETPGFVQSIEVEFDRRTALDNTLGVYTSSAAYASPKSLFGSLAPTESLGFNTSSIYQAEALHPYFGIRSQQGVVYLKRVMVTWRIEMPAALDETMQQSNTIKQIRDGKLYIVRNHITYDAVGNRLK